MASKLYAVPSPEVLLSTWTIDDLADAHAVLNMYRQLDALANQQTTPRR